MFTRAHLIRLVLIIGLHAALAGCAGWISGDFQDPQVRLVKVEIIKARLLEQRFSLRFRVDNPNDFRLPIRGLTYQVHLNGLPLGTGSAREWVTVPANGGVEFEVMLRTNLWRHLKDLAKTLEDPHSPISYGLSGQVRTGLLFGRSVHLQRNGEIIPGDYLPE